MSIDVYIPTPFRRATNNKDRVSVEAHDVRGLLDELEERFSGLKGLVRNERSENALAQLREVYGLLSEHGIGDVVILDLGAIRDFDYYTGVIFEGYGPDLGRPVAQRGRYDGLLERFGRPAPATGFMVQLDLVSEMLTHSGN